MIRNPKSKIRNLCIIILMLVGVLVWVLRCGDVVIAGTYTDSAHGNTLYGVDSSSLTTPIDFDYSVGNCAHCHEQHASIGGTEITPQKFELIYDHWIGQADLFCYQCHKNGGAEMTVSNNAPYCVNFGGRTSYWAYIWPQFCGAYAKYVNCGSRHHLGRIRVVIYNDAYGWGFDADPDPCVACHNPHIAQRSHPVADVSGGGKLNVAIRRPPHYKSTDPLDFLWGDDDNRPGEPERMDEYALSVGGTYQAPYYADTTSGRYEPAGNSTSDGSNLPNYVTFCMDCHVNSQVDPERGSATVKAINWSSTGDRHGAYAANDCESWCQGEGSTRAPYTNPDANYVLSCLDCHEPHGTYKRLHLIRRMINGQEVAADNPTCDQTADWEQICERCHVLEHPGTACSGCHRHGAWDACGSASPGKCAGKPIF